VARAEEIVMDADAIAGSVRRMAGEILEHAAGAGPLALVGIRRGGVPLAEQLAAAIEKTAGRRVPVGTVDIALYRDDASTALPDPKIGPSDVSFEVTGSHVVIVDDVLQTGRTVRAAINCLLDYGRPRRVWLAVLCDRQGRELPLAADFVGRVSDAPPNAKLEARLDDDDPRVVRITE
jgi:pyrimidine operon attenuation protein/uracil phosphoribosyltransferase